MKAVTRKCGKNMCITFLYTNRNNDSSIKYKYKLVLINNRDEFYARKTLKANIFKTESKDVIKVFGTDVETDVVGTWLAVSKRNNDVVRIGNLLNVPGEIVTIRKQDLRGRGPIALDFVDTVDPIKVYNEKLCDVCTSYNSFNFLSVEINLNDIKTFFISNATHSYEELLSAVIGASNSPIDTPFHKVVEGRKKFEKIIHDTKDKSKDELVNELMNLLKCNDKHYPDEELLRRRGCDAELFSSIHVRCNEFYGTRTRTIILVDNCNNIDYIEETMANTDPENAIWERTKFTF